MKTPVSHGTASEPPIGFTGRWVTRECHSWREHRIWYDMEFMVVDGVRHGSFTQRAEDGWLEREGSYRNGQLDDAETWYSRNGGKTISHYLDGKLHGERLYIAPGGYKKQLITYRNGKRHGLQVEWFTSGEIAAQGTNKDDEPWSGEFQAFADGTLCKSTRKVLRNFMYKEGKVVDTDEIVEWDLNGEVLSRGLVKNEGPSIGKIPWQGFFIADDGDRVVTRYYDQGRVLREELRKVKGTSETGKPK